MILLIFVVLAIVWSRMQGSAMQQINHENFESYLKSDDVLQINLIQNAEVPTGEVELTLKSGVRVFMYTSDINEVAHELDTKFPTYTIEDVKREGWFTAYVLPALIVGLMMIVFITYMNGSAGGGSKMMNFGKSHAKLSSSDNKIKFDDVAGDRKSVV